MLATSNSPAVTVPLAPQAAQPSPAPGRPVDLIVIHCSATTSGKPLQSGAPGQPGYKHAAQVIDGWHEQRGFARAPQNVKAFSTGLPHIGYHYVIDLSGAVRSGRGLNEVGAHAQNFNARSVGICLVGGVEPTGAQYTAAQWASLVQVVAMLRAQYGIPAAAPKRTTNTASPVGYTIAGGICGHRDLSPDKNSSGVIEKQEWLKTCPGFDVAAWLANGMQPTADQIFRVPA